MSCTRKEFVAQMKSWVGLKESDGSHKKIVDIYNTIDPLPVGYRLKVSDAWCAATISAAAQVLNATDIIPTECSCPRMVDKAKKMGCWVEADNYIPSPGDILLYDWDDNGKGDNTGRPDHVGGVEKVSSNSITIIEGNYSNSVKRRTLSVNAKYIRGYIVPKYDEAPEVNVPEETGYTLGQFVRDIQEACGAAVDGVVGKETLSKTVTLSRYRNRRHKAVLPVQKRLYALGYTVVGEADGVAGKLFQSAVKAYQADHGCEVDGEITKGNKTWKKLLGVL